MMRVKQLLQRAVRFLRDTEAVAALEYAILVGVVTVGIGAAVVTFQDTITAAIAGIGADVTTGTDIQNAANPTP